MATRTKRQKRGASAQRSLFVQLIEEAFHKPAWHGPNLRGSIRRVSAVQAVRRPGRDRRNIAEIAVHCAYWKYTVRRRVRGDKRGSFPLKGSNWFVMPPRLSDSAWRAHVRMLDEQHRLLVETVTETPWSRLIAAFGGSEKKFNAHLTGIALHDTYHAGQIQTIKALLKQRGRR